MNYTLHQLQIFLKITQTKSVTKASEELHLTQPAVSIQLKNFQDQFDIPITEVVGRKIHITDFGMEIAQAAEKILKEVEAIDHLTLAHKGQLSGRLKVSVVSTGKYLMPHFLAGFMKQHPGVDLVMDVTNKTKVVETLEKNETDFALVSILPEHLKLNTIDLLVNELHLVGNKDLGKKGITNPKLLFSDIPLIFRESGSGTRQSMEKFIAMQKLTVPKKMELTTNEAVKQAVLAGLGYSIMPKIGILNELKNQTLKIIPVKGLPIKTKWQLIWLQGKKLSPVALSYLNYITTSKEQIIQKQFPQLLN